MASTPEDVLGSGCWLLHGGVDSYLHVPVQKRVWAIQTNHGDVRGRVSLIQYCAEVFRNFLILYILLGKWDNRCCNLWKHVQAHM